MPPKQQLDKAAWQWAETTDPEDVTRELVLTAYRLNLKPCKVGACKRNCKGNPLCLNCIGERVWFGEINEDSWHDIEDPNDGRREDGMFVGLKNLGATCYVNTFLQLWFHNPAIRQALYKFREPDLGEVDIVSEKWQPDSIGGHLQLIFALLEQSQRQFIDPETFIDHLGLDAGLQQDAQEFSKLFLALLEDSLSQQIDTSVRYVIQNQFCGEYAYVTTCSRCQNSSKTPSKFYELDLSIRGHKTLEDSIRDFLQEEKLEGDNKYMCSFCSQKENAKRAIQLQCLPPVLNLQLLRFVFDKKTGHKKKLSSFIQFPEVLDMAKFLPDIKTDGSEEQLKIVEEDGVGSSSCIKKDMTYNLTAVLIHRGPTAYSGHYIAHIKDLKTKVWYKFNDEEIERMKGSNLHLGTEDDMQEGSSKQKGRTPKGYHSSRNAYMLVYTKQQELENNVVINSEEEVSSELLPDHIQSYVEHDNEKFEMWVAEMMMMRDRNIEIGKEQQELIKDIYSEIVPNTDESESHEWISLHWLNKWLEEPNKVKEICNKEYVCQHGKLNPNSVVKLKSIRSRGADMLFDKYDGGPRLDAEDSMCYTCIKQRCHMIRMKRRMTEDEKILSMALKANNLVNNISDTVYYWVGKSSLRSWKRLAMEDLEDDHTENGVHKEEKESTENKEQLCQGDQPNLETKENIQGVDPEDGTNDGKLVEEKADDSSSSGGDLKFNEDIVCDHGNLYPDTNCRKLIPEAIWKMLRQYFPECPEYRQDAALCEQCNKQNRQEQETKDMNKHLAVQQKSLLSDLFADRKRPIHLKGPQEVYVVSSCFVEEWRKFIKEPMRREPVTEVCNAVLLCEHGGYLYPTADTPPDLTDYNGKLVYLWPKEWEVISQCFTFDYEISIVKTREDDNTEKTFTLPQVCIQCTSDRLVQEERAKFEYNDAIIYIRKIPKDQKMLDMSTDKKSEDPDFVQQSTSPRSSVEEPPEKMARLEDGMRRKSQRHRKVRGEKEVKVNSSQTLKDLKLQIMKLFSVPPFDQNLTMYGNCLMEDTATLGSLMVSPGAVIFLQADEPVEDPMVLQDLIQVSSGPESGFKGTGLLGQAL